MMIANGCARPAQNGIPAERGGAGDLVEEILHRFGPSGTG